MEDTRTANPVPASPATGCGRDHSTKMGETPHAPSPLRLSSCRRDRITSTPVDEQPDSPTSPSSCTLPNGYSPVMIRNSSLDDYGLPPPPPPVNQEEAHYNDNSPIASYTDASFQSNQDVEPFNCDDLEYGDMNPPGYIADPCVVVRQAISFAETSLKCHNDDPSNEVKYELIEATKSNVMLHGSGYYAHVNFTARAKGEGSQQELFFAELNLHGQGFTTLTCFRPLKEKDDQVGGRMGLQRADDGIDLDHCYCVFGCTQNTQGMERHITPAIGLGADATSFLNLHGLRCFWRV